MSLQLSTTILYLKMLTHSKASAYQAQAEASKMDHAFKNTSAKAFRPRPNRRPPAVKVSHVNKRESRKHTQQVTAVDSAPTTVSEYDSVNESAAPVDPLTRFQLISTMSGTSLSIARETIKVVVLASELSTAVEQLLLKLSAPVAACFSISDVWSGAILVVLMVLLFHLTDALALRYMFTTQPLSARGTASAADFLDVLRTMRWILERATPCKKK